MDFLPQNKCSLHRTYNELKWTPKLSKKVGFNFQSIYFYAVYTNI